ncbi:uroporphyrinogen decarboxylase [Acuticoccus sp.]|uniref:uroporphyrinogen decarboxylase n=1 Tax=Acuticoccus sp. TaxID=1904378 RepID=UPI003B519357
MDTAAPVPSDLVRALRGEVVRPAPVWFMRQAGRYLPEYRELRTQAPSFLDFCYTPELALEATLQPMRRYAFDASIIFSDILVLPHALGQDVWFVEGEGPRLTPLTDAGALSFDGFEAHLAPVYEAVRRMRAALGRDKALFGFCGAPWTLATYMVAGRGGGEQWPARKLAAADPDRFAALIDVLVEAATRHLVAQAHAGADALQIFDSWASALDEPGLARWSIAPIARIVEGVRAAAPGVPIVGFARGAAASVEAFARGTGVDGVSLDWTAPMELARRVQASGVCVQGNLEPARLAAGGDGLDAAVDHICHALRDGPFVFNLGHGISLETPVDHVTRVIERVKTATA